MMAGQVLDENEGWLWDHSDDATLDEIISKSSVMRTQVESICATYLQKVSEEKKLMEKQLDEEAEKAAADRAANGNASSIIMTPFCKPRSLCYHVALYMLVMVQARKKKTMIIASFARPTE